MKKNLTRFLLCALLLLALVIPFVATPAAADGDTPTPAATFKFGDNGAAGHKDGSSDQATYSETSNGYTLNITGGSKMYPSSYDANGNSCIKFGSSSAAGKFTFTVPDAIVKVVIYVAGYKANTAKVTINNGDAQTISTLSNNGEYTAIEVDTSTTKTVSFTTVSGGYRAMMNSIEFHTASTSGGESGGEGSGGEAQTYTATFNVPEGAEAPTVDSAAVITLPEAVAAPEVYNKQSYTFAGWAVATIDGATTEKPELYDPEAEYTLLGDTTFYAVYSYSVTAETPAGTDYVLTDLAEIGKNDEVVITISKGGAYYAMTNNNGTGSAPAATSVTVTNKKLTGTIADNVKWNIVNDGGNVTIYPNGTTSTWLYCTSTNNGVRVGTNDSKVFTIDANSGYLKHSGTSRYIGVYNNQDWRCYTSVNSNITGQTLGFYVKSAGGEQTTEYYVTTLEKTETSCEHIYDEGVETTPPTCTAEGVTTFTCTLCGDTYTEAIEKIDHTYDDGVETTAPGQTTEGVKTFTCTACGNTKTEAIPAIGFTATFVGPNGVEMPTALTGLTITLPSSVAVPEDSNLREYEFYGWAVETIDGEITDNSGIYEAGAELTLTADITLHAVYTFTVGTGEPAWELVTDASLLSAGKKVVIVASGSNFALSTTQNGNNRGQATVTKDENTVDFGEDVQVFTVYVSNTVTGAFGFFTGEGFIYAASSSSNYLRTNNTAILDDKDASWNVTIDSNGVATIVAQGENTRNTLQYNSSSKIFSCYASASQQSVSIYMFNGVEPKYTTNPQKAECTHESTRVDTIEPTCTTEGANITVCNGCGLELDRQAISALGHSYVVEITKTPSCTEEGEKITTCDRDDCDYSSVESISKTEHAYGEGVVTTAPTCTEAGELTFTCADCGDTKTEVIAPQHNIVNNKCTECDFAIVGYFYIATKRTEGNYWYMTNDLGTASTKRYQAVDTGLTDLPHFISSGVAGVDKIFALVNNGDGTYSIYAKGVEGDNYLGWTSGNSGTFVSEAEAIKFTLDKNEDGTVSFHFAASDAERYLALNGTTNNNYFALYKSGQKQDLTLIPVTDVEKEFSGASLVIGEDLSIRFNLDLVHTENINGYTVKFILGGVEHTAEILGPAGAYYADCTCISPEKMGDIVTAQLLYNGEVVTELEYSVLTYVQYQLANSTDEKLKTLLIDLVNYGAAAQKYTGYNTDNLVNSFLTEENKGMASTVVPEDVDEVRARVENDLTKLDILSAGVRFAYNNKIFVRFTAPILASVADGDLADTLKVTVSHGGAEAYQVNIYNNGGGRYVVYSEGILAHEFGEVITFTFTYNETVLATVNYSVNSYAFAMQADEDIGELAIALYRYGKSAEAYALAEESNS